MEVGDRPAAKGGMKGGGAPRASPQLQAILPGRGPP